MKYVKLEVNGTEFWGVLENGKIALLSKPPYEGVFYNGTIVDFDKAKLLAPCDATKIVAIGKNYMDHINEFDANIPKNPIIFLKPISSLTGHNSDIIHPPASKRVDYEGELAFVIKKKAKKVDKRDFAEYILGYTCFNDVTARDIQKADEQWTRGKGYDTFAPMGPILTDEIKPFDLNLATRRNGETVQKSNTKLMIWDIPFLLEFITDCMTLMPGDVVTTGTPSGVGILINNDIVEIEIEGIGTLKNRVVKAD